MTFADRFVDVDGLRLHYCEWGSTGSPAVVLLHGGSAHAHWWDLLAAELADDYHLIAPDLRGHGDSQHADPPAYRISDYAGDIAGLVEELGFGCFHLIGHSLGAMVAASYATVHADRLLSVTMIDAQLRFSPAGVRYLRRLANFPRLSYADRATAIKRFRLMPTQTNAPHELIERMAASAFCLSNDSRWVLKFDRAALGQLEPVDFLPQLSQLTVPMCIVRGEHSSALPVERADTISAQLARCVRVEIPHAHHHVMLDNPRDFAIQVKAFLDGVPRQTGPAANT